MLPTAKSSRLFRQGRHNFLQNDREMAGEAEAMPVDTNAEAGGLAMAVEDSSDRTNEECRDNNLNEAECNGDESSRGKDTNSRKRNFECIGSDSGVENEVYAQVEPVQDRNYLHDLPSGGCGVEFWKKTFNSIKGVTLGLKGDFSAALEQLQNIKVPHYGEKMEQLMKPLEKAIAVEAFVEANRRNIEFFGRDIVRYIESNSMSKTLGPLSQACLHLADVLSSMRGVRDQLCLMGLLPVVSETRDETKTNRSTDSNKEHVDNEAMLPPEKTPDVPQDLEPMLRNQISLSEFLFNDHVAMGTLGDVNNAYQKYVAEATFLQPIDARKQKEDEDEDDDDDKEEEEEEEEEEEVDDKRISIACRKLTGRLEQSKTQEKNVAEQCYFPGPTSHEVNGYLCVFEVLLRAVCNIGAGREDETKDTKSPPKTAKLAVSRRRHSLCVLRDDGMELLIALTPFQTHKWSVEELWRQGRDRALSHLAKHLRQGFRFTGGGVDSHATAVFGSLMFVEVIQLRLENVGRPNCALVLMTRENFDWWYVFGNSDGKEKHKNAAKSFRKRLFDGRAKEEMPAGFRALYAVVWKSLGELFGPDWMTDAVKAPTLGDFIGSGSFADVFVRRTEQNIQGVEQDIQPVDDETGELFVKVDCRCKAVKSETEALKAVGPHKNIPRVWSQYGETTKVMIGGVNLEVPSVTLSPRGESLERCLYTQRDNRNLFRDRLKMIGEGIADALRHVHSKGYVHNDVSVDNIVVQRLRDGSYRPILIDFGAACSAETKLTSFCGTAEFASMAVHVRSNGEWNPSPVDDMTSLAFTMAVVSNLGSIPRRRFPREVQRDGFEIFQRRREWAIRQLEGFEDDAISRWCEWIKEETECCQGQEMTLMQVETKV